jgi:hypothetical protein
VRILLLSICEPIGYGALGFMKSSEFKILRLCQVILSILVVFYFPTITFADRALRCHGRLVYIGDPKVDVLSKCGEPDHIDQWEENPMGTLPKFSISKKNATNCQNLLRGLYNLSVGPIIWDPISSLAIFSSKMVNCTKLSAVTNKAQ